MNLNEWAKKIHQTAKAHGWYDWPRGMGDFCANFHGEVSELWEAYRNGKLESPCDKTPDLTCDEEEVADLLIRVLDYAAFKGMDVERAVKLKAAYNETRPYRHGGKQA